MLHVMLFSRTLFFIIPVIVFVAVFTGCSDIQKEQTTQSNIQTLANGYWEVQNETLPSSQKTKGFIYDYGKYGIKSEADNSVTITWDNGLSCPRSKGKIQGNKISLVDRGVETEIVVHDAERATIKFKHGPKTITRDIKKIRTDPKMICL
jgi:hypothetical protein